MNPPFARNRFSLRVGGIPAVHEVPVTTILLACVSARRAALLISALLPCRRLIPGMIVRCWGLPVSNIYDADSFEEAWGWSYVRVVSNPRAVVPGLIDADPNHFQQRRQRYCLHAPHQVGFYRGGSRCVAPTPAQSVGGSTYAPYGGAGWRIVMVCGCA